MAATATATKRPPGRRKQWGVLDVPVAFGNVSFGDGTARIAVRVDREVLNDLDVADTALGGTRVKGRIVLGRADDARGQGRLAYDEETAIEATFDSKGFNVNAKRIGFGLTVNLQEIKDRIETFAGFSKHDGRFQVASVSAIAGEEEDPEEDDEEEDEDDE